MVSFKASDVAIGRVISEDEGYMLLEVAKNEIEPFHLDAEPSNNRFYTLLFVQFADKGLKGFRKPWEPV